jgi:ABC-2 type transport system permease protein
MSIVSTTFVALPYTLVFLREEGVLKRLRGTPLPAGAYLGALAAHAVTNAAIQLAIVILAGRAFFGVGWPGDWPQLVVFAVAGVACFALLGAALANAIPNFESTAAYVNAAFLPLIAISGVFYDADDAPAFLRDIAEGLPLVHVIDGLSGAMVTGESAWSGLIVIAIWTVAAGFVAVRGFRWEARTG